MEASQATMPLNWTRTSPTIYERAVDDVERFFLFVEAVGQGCSDKQNWHPAAGIKIKTRPEQFVEEVRQVWRILRYDHPCLSAIIESDRWIYHVADEQELSRWLEETVQVHDVFRSARELFPFETSPNKRVVLHVFPQTQELVIQGPHTHLDAIGMAKLFDHLLRLLVNPSPAEPPWGDEGKNLTPPLTITARVPKYTAEQKRAWDENLSHFMSQFPTVRLHNENPGAPATRAKLQWLTFTREETAGIAARSKQLGFTVTAAAQAAISHATRIHGGADTTTHATMAVYNAREYIDPQVWPHENLVGQHIFAMPVVFPITGSFSETARQAGKVFKGFKQNDLLRATSPFWATDIPAALSTPMPPGLPVAADLQLSSVGIVDRYLRDAYGFPGDGGPARVEVHNLWVALDVLTPNVALEMWTFRGELVMQLIYNEAYHREESMARFLRLIREQLQQGLGVDLGFDLRVPGEEVFMRRGIASAHEFPVKNSMGAAVSQVDALVN